SPARPSAVELRDHPGHPDDPLARPRRRADGKRPRPFGGRAPGQKRSLAAGPAPRGAGHRALARAAVRVAAPGIRLGETRGVPLGVPALLRAERPGEGGVPHLLHRLLPALPLPGLVGRGARAPGTGPLRAPGPDTTAPRGVPR